jgi:hypothetical protein
VIARQSVIVAVVSNSPDRQLADERPFRAAEAETFIWQKQTNALFIAELVFQMHSGNGSRMSLGQKEDSSEKSGLSFSVMNDQVLIATWLTRRVPS